MKKIAFVALLIFIVAFQIFNFVNRFKKASEVDGTVFQSVANKFQKCLPFKRSLENNVILRIDDVQATYLRDVSIRMAKDAFKLQAPVTFSVIPVNIESDLKLNNFIGANLCNIEIALHGFNHQDEPPEFEGITKEEANEKIVKGSKALKDTYNITPEVFIPPRNIYSKGTLDALKENNFKVLSSWGGESYFDYTAALNDLENGSTPEHSVNDVLEICLGSFVKKTPCVIMLHPQEFVLENKFNEEKYADYLALLDVLSKNGANFVTFMDVYNFENAEHKLP